MTRIVRNQHVLAVPHMDTSATFFVDVLGFRELPRVEGWRFVYRDECVFMLGECPDALPVRDLGDHAYVAYLVVDDAAAYHAALESRGVRLSSPLADKPWKMREFGIRTPDGHRIMIGQELE